jgi:hypothetical protein
MVTPGSAVKRETRRRRDGSWMDRKGQASHMVPIPPRTNRLLAAGECVWCARCRKEHQNLLPGQHLHYYVKMVKLGPMHRRVSFIAGPSARSDALHSGTFFRWASPVTNQSWLYMLRIGLTVQIQISPPRFVERTNTIQEHQRNISLKALFTDGMMRCTFGK